ncbi:MAG: MmgE/PrpD family protein [Hyphomicrobiaceae bacterium]|nr:MmgE/PrpD family protein [Hyphomicrobiaceae bacterium]MCC0025259.1 MmgE/PrpD family protein [Hyphomicrobiaceae bacterium]
MPSSDVSRGLSAQLAAFVADSVFADIPDPVKAHGTRAIFNGFGTALGGSSDQALQRLSGVLGAFSSAQKATMIGSSLRYDAPTAAFLNAAAMNVFDFDDNHTGTIIHPTAPVLPAVLALAETRGMSGKQVLHAVILGIEIACRLGIAISPGHYSRGWHITATCGVFGAAVACSKLLGLNQERLIWALGNASAQSSGLVETLGFMAKSVGVGAAARNGLMSALMAEAGVEGPSQPLEGPRGFLPVTSDSPQPELALEALGAKWEILRDSFKPYPCGIVLNPVIDACLAARNAEGFEPLQIASVRVRGNPLLRARTDRPNVTTGREAQVSAQHAVAVCLLKGRAGVAEFSDEMVADPDVRSFRNRVEGIEIDEAIGVDAAEVELQLEDGTVRQVRVDFATGTLKNPMSDDMLRDKFDTLASYGCPALHPAPLSDVLWKLPDLDGVKRLMAAARPQT